MRGSLRRQFFLTPEKIKKAAPKDLIKFFKSLILEQN